MTSTNASDRSTSCEPTATPRRHRTRRAGIPEGRTVVPTARADPGRRDRHARGVRGPLRGSAGSCGIAGTDPGRRGASGALRTTSRRLDPAPPGIRSDDKAEVVGPGDLAYLSCGADTKLGREAPTSTMAMNSTYDTELDAWRPTAPAPSSTRSWPALCGLATEFVIRGGFEAIGRTANLTSMTARRTTRRRRSWRPIRSDPFGAAPCLSVVVDRNSEPCSSSVA